MDALRLTRSGLGRFVLALQSVRLVFVIGFAPLITRSVVRHSPHLQEVRNEDCRI
jgi:uncharacterized membrane protein AbrB (regulator of aidB expression)